MLEQIDIVQLIGQTFTIVGHSDNTKSTLEHDSLIIWPDTNTYFWYTKQAGGGPYQWLKYVLHVPFADMEGFVSELATFIPKVADSEFAVRYPIGRVVYNEYMKSRNITEATALRFKLEQWGTNTIIPMYNKRGYRAGSLVRRPDTNLQYLKYRKYQSEQLGNLWPYHEYKYVFDKPVFVFEGAWSAMRWWQVSGGKIAALALIGTNANTDTLTLLDEIENVRFVLDNDPESKAGEGVYERVVKNRLYDKHLGWKFIMPEEYPDEMSDRTITRLLKMYAKVGQSMD